MGEDRRNGTGWDRISAGAVSCEVLGWDSERVCEWFGTSAVKGFASDLGTSAVKGWERRL